MAHIQELVVGVDGSDEALDAVRWAVAHAERTESTVRIVCAYAIASYSAAALDGGLAVMDDAALRLGAERVVQDAAAVAVPSGVPVTTQVEVGDPSSVLVELSDKADLVVIGSKGGGGFADRLLGSVSSSVPAHARCPVVVVPPHRSGKPFLPVRRIVVGTDGSDMASSALKKAVDEAVLWDADLTVVTAIPIATGGGMMGWVPPAINRQSMMAEVMASLDAAIADAVEDREVRVARHALDGSPAALLTEFSTAVDLVVVGTRGRGGFAGMLLGSTSQTVLHHSTCPVMTVPSRHRDRNPGPAQAWERR
ncbi:universal stress protein [Actinomyces minihominis]|uniref:universal stress protein n=1 Tax=Actinomyces minihominis TaxID=2002838 RepID=UPI000C07A09C|nr:universal stress protein [Actinomyces minihominis]